jgi:hypothetical protein
MMFKLSRRLANLSAKAAMLLSLLIRWGKLFLNQWPGRYSSGSGERHLQWMLWAKCATPTWIKRGVESNLLVAPPVFG